MRISCPTLVGRAGEYAALVDALGEAGAGRGGLWCVVAESGLGKTRLAGEIIAAAQSRGLAVSRGVATENTRTPYRPLTEALLDAWPDGPPELEDLRLFRGAVAQVVPVWGQDVLPEAPPVVVGEAVRRLLVRHAAENGGLVVLEDLHWADPETLEVVEYLAGHLRHTRVLIVALGRPESGPAWRGLIDGATRAGRCLWLHPLEPGAVLEMVRSSLEPAAVPDDVLGVLVANAAGSPFLVEELLTAWRRDGELAQTMVSDAFAHDVARRVATLSTEATEVLLAAALTDHALPLPDLAALVDVPLPTAREALDAAQRLGLVRSDGPRQRFVHALTRQAVLGCSSTSRRAVVAGRMVEALARRDGHRLQPELVAELALIADDRSTAHRALMEAGNRDRTRNALRTSRSRLERACEVAPSSSARALAEEALARTLLQSGHAGAATQMVEALVETLSGGPLAPQVDALILAARASIAGGRWEAAEDHLASAEALCADRVPAQLSILRAEVALAQNRPDVATELAVRAVADADAAGDVADGCEALELLGRAVRTNCVEPAREAFTQMLRRAERAGLRFWVTRGLYQLGTLDLLARMDVVRLERARSVAERSGSLAMLAELQVEVLAGLQGQDRDHEALDVGRDCIETARLLDLPLVEAKAWLLLGELHAKRAEKERVETACVAALTADDGPETAGGVWGDCRALLDLARERREQAISKLDRAAALYAGRPAVIPRPSYALRHLLLTIEGAADEVPADWGATRQLCMGNGYLEYAEAVRAGRRGDAESAMAAFVRGDDALSWAPWHRHLARRHLAEAALADGWADPTPWLQEAAPFFDHFGNDRVAGACRSLMRRTGRHVARPGPATAVPERLRAAGVTRRENDVLQLLCDGVGNADIAHRLVLSQRTVEHHVSSLLRKLACGNRAQLVAVAGSHES